ncbi:MAG: HdeD family acid-resistance protein [Brevundimonas sp.]
MNTARPTFESLTRPFMADAWWSVLIRGVATLLFGLLTLAWPDVTLLSLVILYGCFALLDGGVALGTALTGGKGSRWMMALTGVIGIAAGAVALFWPGMTAVVLVLIIGWWSVFRGVFEIIAAIRLRREIPNEWMLILSGAVSILFGLAVLAAPGAGALALLWLIGGWAVVIGVLLVALSFKLRRRRSKVLAA